MLPLPLNNSAKHVRAHMLSIPIALPTISRWAVCASPSDAPREMISVSPIRLLRVYTRKCGARVTNMFCRILVPRMAPLQRRDRRR